MLNTEPNLNFMEQIIRMSNALKWISKGDNYISYCICDLLFSMVHWPCTIQCSHQTYSPLLYSSDHGLSWVSPNLLMGYCYMNLRFIPYIVNIHSIAIRCDLCLNLPISKVNKDLEIVYFGSEIIIFNVIFRPCVCLHQFDLFCITFAL